MTNKPFLLCLRRRPRCSHVNRCFAFVAGSLQKKCRGNSGSLLNAAEGCYGRGRVEVRTLCNNSPSRANTFGSMRTRLSVKLRDEYNDYKVLPPALLAQQGGVGPTRPGGPAAPGPQRRMITAGGGVYLFSCFPFNANSSTESAADSSSRIIAKIDSQPAPQPSTFSSGTKLSQALALHKTVRTVKPVFHPQWKLMRVISGHLGWVRSIAVEPGNKWFATGAGDRVVKIWDMASGELKLSLTGHISTVRGLAVSNRHPYLFSCGEDKVCLSYLWLLILAQPF